MYRPLPRPPMVRSHASWRSLQSALNTPQRLCDISGGGFGKAGLRNHTLCISLRPQRLVDRHTAVGAWYRPHQLCICAAPSASMPSDAALTSAALTVSDVVVTLCSPWKKASTVKRRRLSSVHTKAGASEGFDFFPLDVACAFAAATGAATATGFATGFGGATSPPPSLSGGHTGGTPTAAILQVRLLGVVASASRGVSRQVGPGSGRVGSNSRSRDYKKVRLRNRGIRICAWFPPRAGR